MMLGTAVKIESTIVVDDGASVNTATITILNPDGTEAIGGSAMTADTASVFSYIYQSSVTDVEGEYLTTVTATSGGYTAISRTSFRLND